MRRRGTRQPALLLNAAILLGTIPGLINGWVPSLDRERPRVSPSLSAGKIVHQRDLYDDSRQQTNEKKSRAPSAELSRKQFGRNMLVASLSIFSSLAPHSKANAMITDSKTGIALPEEGEIGSSIPTDWDGVDNPFEGVSDKTFGRLDSTPDSIFYADPRFVEHVDDQAVQSMTAYISQEAIPRAAARNKQQDGIAVLDLCSSWTSHIDMNSLERSNTNVKPKRISGLGMNAKELEQNRVLNDYVVKDLNANPTLPYEDATFDVVLCQLSIDYLTKPKEVLKEVSRILKPGGTVHILFSNRLFLSKAVALWTGADDIDHAYTVGCYLHFCEGGYKNIQAKDLSTRKGRDRRITGDPLYVVTATN